MHPYLFPWVLPSGAVEALAYLVAVAAAAIVATWWAGQKGKAGFWPRFVVPFAVVAGVGLSIVRRNAPFDPQPLPLHTYGLMIALGFLTAAHLAARASQRFASLDGTAFFLPSAPSFARARKEGPEAVGRAARQHFLDMVLWIFVGAMIGSRVLFIVVNWSGPDGYGANPARIFQIWKGGLVFYGGFIGAALASVLYARKHRLNFRAVADIAIPGVALGHFFGRMGCISAGCCWGKLCDADFLFGIKFPEGALAYKDMLGDPAHQDYLLQHGHTPPLHPTQLYEGMGELALFFVLLAIQQRKRFHGQVLTAWLGLYALLRLSIETFRGDWGRGMLFSWPASDPLLLSTSQVVGIGMLVLALVLYLRWRPTPGAVADAAQMAKSA